MTNGLSAYTTSIEFKHRFIAIFFAITLCLKSFSQNNIPPGTTTSAALQTDVTAVMGAMESEVELLKNSLQLKQDTSIEGIHFYTGKLNNQQVVITRSGVGKVNAAIITTILLEHFKPKHLLFTGIAGSLNPFLQPGDVVVANKIGYHDYGKKTANNFENWATKNPYDFKTNPMFFLCDSFLLAITKTAIKHITLQRVNDRLPIINFGTIVTGDIFLSDGKTGSELRVKLGGDAVEMEGAAVAQTCYQQHTPFLIIRSLSDNANHSASLDFDKYGKIAAENSAAIIMEILKLMKIQ